MNERKIELNRVGTFECPRVNKVRPVVIPSGFEYIEIVSQGTIFFELNGERHKFGEGTIFWHQAGEYTICETSASDPYKCFVLSFQVSTRNRPMPRVTIWDSPSTVMDFCKECFKSFHCHDVNLQALSNYAYSSLIWKGSLRPVEMELAIPDVLRRAIKFIQKNFNQDISMEDISKHAGASKATIFALFNKHIQLTPFHYLQKQRLSKARRELTNPQYTIKEVASNCGFETLEVFYRQFKRDSGITPGEYRKNNLAPTATIDE